MEPHELNEPHICTECGIIKDSYKFTALIEDDIISHEAGLSRQRQPIYCGPMVPITPLTIHRMKAMRDNVHVISSSLGIEEELLLSLVWQQIMREGA